MKVYSGKLSLAGISPSISRSEIKEIIFTESVTFPTISRGLFGGKNYLSLEGAMINLTTLSGLEHISTSQVEDMSFMFNGCISLRTLNLEAFDTQRVISMSNMFANCHMLSSLDLKTFDTENVKNFDSMFLDCRQLKQLVLTSFNIEGAITKLDMLKGCSSLINLYLPSGISRVENELSVG